MSILAALIVPASVFAQVNFSYTPEKPKPGDEVRFTYTPSGDLTGIMQIPEAFVIKDSSNWMSIENVTLQRESGKLTGSIKTDTSYTFMALSFKDGDVYDNNNNEGYVLNFYQGDKVKKNSYARTAYFFSFYGPYRLAMKDNSKKAAEYYEEEFKLYPENREKLLVSYLNDVYRYDKEKGASMIQSEVEKTMKDTLDTREEFSKVERLYGILKLKQQAAFINGLRKEKIGLDKSNREDFFEIVDRESDLDKKEILLRELNAQIDSSSDNKVLKSMREFLVGNLARSYMKDKNWNGFRRSVALIESNSSKSNLLNSAAWSLKDDSTNLQLAGQLSEQSVQLSKKEWQKPSGAQPNMMTFKEWQNYNKNNYATYADTYAVVLYRIGNYKKALQYAKEANVITKGESADHNMTYALIAEKAMKPARYKPLVEQFVKAGKANATINDVLKRLYVKNNKSETGFENYLTALEKEAHVKMVADLKKEMLNDASPQFTLKDLSGNTVNMADLKGKTVVVDFWATWCGPCIASMPGMKKMVNKYKDDPNVKFVFIDTWQNEDNETDVVKKFIADKGYSEFHVLMDLDDKVVSSFKVEGIPTKFIIGKDGNIKFKEVGFDGEDNLIKKLPAMIELAN